MLSNDSLHGQLTMLPDAVSGRILVADKGFEAKMERNKVLLFLDDAMALGDTSRVWQGMSLSHVQRIEAFDVNAGATIAANIGMMAAAFAMLTLILLLLKSSCPFVYSHAPDGAHFEGEIFSGAIYPQLERHDRLPLQYIEAMDGEYRVTLANKAREVQSTDLIRLITVDHEPGTDALFDKTGAVHAIRDPQAPLSARDLNGTDARPLLLEADGIAWTGDPDNARPLANDGIDLRFQRPVGATTGKLMITARNTFWVDRLYLLLLDEQGTMAPRIDSVNARLPADELRAWSREQRLPLAVWMEQGKGHWVRMEQFELAGPMAWRSDVLEIDLGRITGNEVHLRLDCGFQFWEVDQVAMDFTSDFGLVVQEIDAVSAIDRNGIDVLPLLNVDDDRHYVQPEVDDAAEIIFPAPLLDAGLERSIFLHGKGHYRILHEPVPIEPDLLFLRGFTKADAFPKYSRDRWRELVSTPETLTP